MLRRKSVSVHPAEKGMIGGWQGRLKVQDVLTQRENRILSPIGRLKKET